MTPLLFIFLMVLAGPFLVTRWRASLLGLALQGALLTWMALGREWSASTAILLIDFALIRTWLAPRMLARALRSVNAPSRNDVLPPNLFSWALAGGLMLLAFRFAFTIIPDDTGSATHLAVASTGVLFGLLVLSTVDTPFAQIVGILRIENAIALFELGSTEQLPLRVQVAIGVIFLFTVVTLATFLRRLERMPADETALEEAPTL